MRNKQLGVWGESLVAQTLEKRGHRILRRNWRTRWMEIDLLTQINHEIWVVEVKTRSSHYFGHPHEAVTPQRRQKLQQAAQVAAHQYPQALIRCVVASVTFSPKPKIKFINLI